MDNDRPSNRLSELVFDRIHKLIVAGGIKPGDRLPSERELAADLGVSNNTVREALKRLESLGAIIRRPRVGTILREVDFTEVGRTAQFLMVRSDDDYRELLEARHVVEMAALNMAAKNATESDFNRMFAALDRMQVDIDAGHLPLDSEKEFHDALIMSTHNKFVCQFSNLISRFFEDPRSVALPPRDLQIQALEEHKKIAELLQQGDAKSAAEILDQHLSRIPKTIGE